MSVLLGLVNLVKRSRVACSSVLTLGFENLNTRKAMSTYKLYYFNSRGYAETSRIIFAQAGVKYEDVRISGEQWVKEYKQSKMSYYVYGVLKCTFCSNAILMYPGTGSGRYKDCG